MKTLNQYKTPKERVCSCGATVTHTMSGLAPIEWSECQSCYKRKPFTSYEKMDIGLSEYCNLKCQMCRRPSEAIFMDKNYCMNVLSEAAEIGVQTISFSGGEPFVHPDVMEILEHGFGLGLKVQLVTNGTLLNPRKLAALERLDCMTVSVDGLEEVHDRIRGQQGAFRRTEKALRMLAESPVCWGTNTVMQRDNAHQLYDLFSHIQSIGGRKYSYCGFSHVELVPETMHLAMSAEQQADAAAQLVKIAKAARETDTYFNDREQLLTYFDEFADKQKRYRPQAGCRVPLRFIGFTSHGFYLCWHVGKNLKSDSLIEALSSDLAQEIVREGLAKRCVACNTFNYSWDDEWNSGIMESVRGGEFEEGVIALAEPLTQQLSGPTAGNTVEFVQLNADMEETIQRKPWDSVELVDEQGCVRFNLPQISQDRARGGRQQRAGGGVRARFRASRLSRSGRSSKRGPVAASR